MLDARYKRLAKSAVKMARLYLGAVDRAPLKNQQQLYDRMIQAVNATATACGMTTDQVMTQVIEEARRQGVIQAMPGKTY